MDMAGLARQIPNGEAAVRAIEAGVDMLLMPPNPDEAIRAVAAAVQSGRISRQRVEQSVLRILAAKARVGLHKNKIVNTEDISDVLDSPESAQSAQQAAEKAITLVRNEGSPVPLKNPAKACWFILAESRYGQQGQALTEELRKHTRESFLIRWDPLVPASEMDVTLDRTPCETYVVPSFVSASAYRGNVALAGAFPQLIEKLSARKTPVVMVSLGNPYLLRAFPKVDAYMATFSVAPTAEVAAVRALYGDIPITGKLPVTIPGLAKYGEGIQLSK
jgi:beta-N-acetylhexosaminidase